MFFAINLNKASCALELRDDLIRAGCNEPVATAHAKAIGKIIDHISEERRALESKIDLAERNSQLASCDFNRGKAAVWEKIVGIAVIALVLLLTAGVLIALRH